jgi:predicted acyl esterase
MNPGALSREWRDGGLPELQVAWFDHFLRGADNGVLDEPPVRLYLTGREAYIDEPRWPLPTREETLFLAPGSLGDAPVDEASPSVITHVPERPNRTPQDVFDQREFERGCLTFTSAALEEPLEVVGTPRLVLFASTDAPDVDWCVRLCDVDEDGRSRLLNVGALKGSHVRSHEHPIELERGVVYRFEMEVWPIANVFLPGHSVRVAVSTSDFPFFESNPQPSVSRVFHDASRPSALVLPPVDR